VQFALRQGQEHLTGRRVRKACRERRETALVAADDAELLTREPGPSVPANTTGLERITNRFPLATGETSSLTRPMRSEASWPDLPSTPAPHSRASLATTSLTNQERDRPAAASISTAGRAQAHSGGSRSPAMRG
jgi:hypothetical protein